MGQTNWCLVLEACEEALLYGPELLSMTTEPFLAMLDVSSQLEQA